MDKTRKAIDFEIIVYLVMTLLIPLFVTKGFTHEPSTAKHLFYVVGFAVIFVASLLKKGKLSIEFGYIHLAFMGIGLSALLSLITVSMDNPQYFGYSLEIALYTVFLSLTAIYISNKFDTITKIEITLFFFIVGAAIVAINALINFYAGYDMILGKVGEPFARASARSTIGNPNFVSDYMGMTIPMIIYFIISRKPLGKVFRSLGGQVFLKTLMVAMLVPMVASVFVAQTRTVITAILFGNILFLVAYAVFRKNRAPELPDNPAAKSFRRLSIIFLLIALLIVSVLSVLYLTPTALTGDGRINIAGRLEYALTSSGSWKERFSAWHNSLYQLLDDSNRLRIPFGTGIGTFQLYHLLYSPQVLSENPDFMTVWNNFKRTHNDYIQGLGELGLIGFIFILLLLVFLVVGFFRNLLRTDNRRDLLLYGSLGAGIFSFAAHSFFEFPLHMQPNLMLAIFITALAMGNYFCRDLKKRVIPKSVVAIVIFALSGVLMFLKTTSFLGEGYFRIGQTDQQYYLAYSNQAQSLNASSLIETRKMISEATGEYAYLSDVNSYMEKRGNELKSKYPGATPVKLLESAENERQNEMTRLLNDINTRLRQYDLLTARANDYYEKAIESFRTSHRISPTFGKGLWYLAGLGTKTHRLEQSKDNPELMRRVLTGLDDFGEDIIVTFEGNLDVIPLKNREIRTLPFRDIMLENPGIFEQADLVNGLQLYFITQIQMILDAANYYESSMILFSERQTPRILGRLYTSVNSELKKYYSFIRARDSLLEQAFGDSESFKKILAETIIETGNRADYWFDLAITLLPGTWNRYPDWKDIYLEYMNSVDSFGNNVSEKTELILEVARRHVWASENMGPYSPDETLRYAINWANRNLSDQELASFRSELKSIYSRIVELNAEVLKSGRSLSDTVKGEIATLISLYESL
jgi:O-antigen ligase